MAKHEVLRLQILQAKYGNIKDERTSVHMSINGATQHAHFRTIVRVLRVAGMPNTLRNPEERMVDEYISMTKEEVYKTQGGTSNDLFGNQAVASTSSGRGRTRGRGRHSNFKADLLKDVADIVRNVVQEHTRK